MKQRYREFCEGNPEVSIFMQPWWLDIVCDGAANWDVAMVEKGGLVMGIWPYFLKRKLGFKGIGMPPFTPYMGFKLFYPPNQKTTTRISYENKTVAGLNYQLPRVSFIEQHLLLDTKSWLPLHWLKFDETTRYTYIINDISQIEQVFENYAYQTKNAIRKASNSITVTISNQTESLFRLLIMTYGKNRIAVPFNQLKLEALFEKCRERGCGYLFQAEDKSGQVHAARFIINDQDTLFSPLAANDTNLQASQAMSLLNWEIIRHFAEKGYKKFDFCGSMIAGVEHFNRRFGGQPVPYFRVTKELSAIYFWLRCANDFKNRFWEK